MKPQPLKKVTALSVSIGCINLVKKFEGFSIKAYPDPGTGAEPITIGYGATRYSDGSKIKLGDVVTPLEAERLLLLNLEQRANAIRHFLPLSINQNQFDAVLSFVYNCGVGAFEGSTLRKIIWQNPNDPAIRAEFAKWNKAGGKVLAGLVKRRAAEAELYFTPPSEIV